MKDKDITSEVFFRTARSGGKGGQNVNKVETMAEAWWDVVNSQLYTAEDKELIGVKLQNRINKDGFLIVRSSESRSQLENKAIALKKMKELIAQSLVRPKKRKPTKPSRAAREARLDNKKKDSQKKQMRRKDW